MDQSDNPITKNIYDKRKSIAEIANYELISQYRMHDIIEDYAQKFSIDPDTVYASSRCSTVLSFIVKWKRKSEFNDRYIEIDRLMSKSQ